MAPVPKNTKSHFTHPNHPLACHSGDGQDYTCDGCKTSGSGSRFRCHPCNFDLHEYCANCPEKLSSSSIHHHFLTLVQRKPGGDRLLERICDICRDPVEGLFYRCKDCDFDAHPLCSQLPKELHHAVDSNHPLKLWKLPSGSCAVCKKDCSSLWVYGCDICRVNIHPDCLFEPYGSPAPPPSQEWSGSGSGTTSRGIPPQSQDRSGSGTTSRGIPPPWAAGPPPFPGGGYPWNGGYYGNFGMGGHSGAYGYAAPYGVPDYHFGYPNYGFMPSNVNYPAPDQAVNVAPPPSSSSGGKTRKSMFALVGRLTFGVMSSVIFGFPIGF